MHKSYYFSSSKLEDFCLWERENLIYSPALYTLSQETKQGLEIP